MIRVFFLVLPLGLSACTASVSTFSADFSAPPANASEARAACDAELRGRSTTSQITIGPGGGASTTRERMDVCLKRYGYGF